MTSSSNQKDFERLGICMGPATHIPCSTEIIPDEDQRLLVEALLHPPEPTQALIAALKGAGKP